MTTKWKELSKNNRYVDERLLDHLKQLTPAVKTVEVKSAGYVINHPLDSNMFREALKDSNKKPNSQYITTAVSSIRF